jgi:pilus assembly protein CpaF
MSSESSSTPLAVLSVHVRALRVDERITLPLGDRELLFGREESCDVVLSSDIVSRRHLAVGLCDDGLVLRDMSSHGTRVDGLQLVRSRMQVGPSVELSLGPYLMSLRLTRPPTLPRARRRSEALADAAVSSATRRDLRTAVLDSLDLAALDRARMDPESMLPSVRDALARAAARMPAKLPAGDALERVLTELCDEILGLGPLEPLLADEAVSEIMVVDPLTIFVERHGKLELSGARFTDENAVRAVLERIVTPLGRRIDESQPMVDARLTDGSRVNAVIPPLATRGPALTIRRFPRTPLTLARLVELGAMSAEMAEFFLAAVRARVNVVIAGGTGSGKTTLLNVLSTAIADGERIVTIEDAAELRLAQRHVVSLESRPANLEGKGAIGIRDLVKNALRMRPDRIIVGECRGGEALDMLQAMNTGHDGSMTTMHANSPREAVQRLETLCLMAGVDLPLTAIRRQIAGSLHLLVQQARFQDGIRRITHVSEVLGVDDRGEVELRELFRFLARGARANGTLDGEFLATGAIPSFVDRMLACGAVAGGVQ